MYTHILYYYNKLYYTDRIYIYMVYGIDDDDDDMINTLTLVVLTRLSKCHHQQGILVFQECNNYSSLGVTHPSDIFVNFVLKQYSCTVVCNFIIRVHLYENESRYCNVFTTKLK